MKVFGVRRKRKDRTRKMGYTHMDTERIKDSLYGFMSIKDKVDLTNEYFDPYFYESISENVHSL